MKIIHWLIIGVLSCLLISPSWAKKEAELKELQNPGFIEKPDWFKASFLDVREDIAEATHAGRRLVFYFYQDGCPYCKKLLTVNFAQKTIVDKTRQNFDIVAVNMWGDREITDFNGKIVKEKDFAANLRVMFTPTLLFFTEKGEVALRVNGYYPPEKFMAALDYVAGRNENNMRFQDFLQSAAIKSSHGELHVEPYFLQAPYDLSQRSKDKKYLLVLFEQKECPACDELHKDILQREETRELIKQFDVVQLDMWSNEEIVTPVNGKQTIVNWSHQLDVKYAPSFIFFDREGKEVIRMEAYLKSFHVQSVMDYVASSAYKQEPSFQRYIDERAEAIRAKGIEINLMD